MTAYVGGIRNPFLFYAPTLDKLPPLLIHMANLLVKIITLVVSSMLIATHTRQITPINRSLVRQSKDHHHNFENPIVPNK